MWTIAFFMEKWTIATDNEDVMIIDSIVSL